MIVKRKRTWPTILFIAASAWFAIASLLTTADKAWRAVAEDAPAQSSLHADTAGLLTDANILIQIRDGQGQDAGSVRSRLAAATYPLGLDIRFDTEQPGPPRLTATPALSRGLGPQCVPDAVQPLIEREAAGSDRTYLASLGVEIVQAAYEADRFGRPVFPDWLLPSLAALFAASAMVWRRVGAQEWQPPSYVSSAILTWSREKLKTRLARIQGDIEDMQAMRAKLEPAATELPAPNWWERMNIRKQLEDRRKAARVATRTSLLAEKLVGLQADLATVKSEIAANEQRLLDDRKKFDLRLEDRAWMASFWRSGVAGLALVAISLAAAHAATVMTSPGAFITAAKNESMLFRADTMMATALSANQDLVGKVATYCNARVVEPSVRSMIASETFPTQDPIQGSMGRWPPILPPQPSDGNRIQCKIGNPCGAACIPAGRVCWVGTVAPGGQACGKGYISRGKTCQIDRTPPPAASAAIRLPEPAELPTTGSQAPPLRQTGEAQYESRSAQTDISTGGSGANIPPSRNTASTTNKPTPSTSPTVGVHGYTRSNGTVVQPYERSAPGYGPGHSGHR